MTPPTGTLGRMLAPAPLTLAAALATLNEQPRFTRVAWNEDMDADLVAVDAFAASIVEASGPELVRLLANTPDLVFNSERKALQLRSCRAGGIAMHVPLRPTQVAALVVNTDGEGS